MSKLSVKVVLALSAWNIDSDLDSGQLSPQIVFTKHMETLEFIIYPDGRVQENVTGIVGASCAEVTAAIEAQLGQVVSQEQTSEYFSQTDTQSLVATNQATFSEW